MTSATDWARYRQVLAAWEARTFRQSAPSLDAYVGALLDAFPALVAADGESTSQAACALALVALGPAAAGAPPAALAHALWQQGDALDEAAEPIRWLHLVIAWGCGWQRSPDPFDGDWSGRWPAALVAFTRLVERSIQRAREQVRLLLERDSFVLNGYTAAAQRSDAHLIALQMVHGHCPEPYHLARWQAGGPLSLQGFVAQAVRGSATDALRGGAFRSSLLYPLLRESLGLMIGAVEFHICHAESCHAADIRQAREAGQHLTGQDVQQWQGRGVYRGTVCPTCGTPYDRQQSYALARRHWLVLPDQWGGSYTALERWRCTRCGNLYPLRWRVCPLCQHRGGHRRNQLWVYEPHSLIGGTTMDNIPDTYPTTGEPGDTDAAEILLESDERSSAQPEGEYIVTEQQRIDDPGLVLTAARALLAGRAWTTARGAYLENEAVCILIDPRPATQPQQVDITITVFPLAGDAAALEGQPLTIQASEDSEEAGPTCYGRFNRRGQLLLRNVAAGTYQAQLTPAADWLTGAADWLQQTLAALLIPLPRLTLAGVPSLASEERHQHRTYQNASGSLVATLWERESGELELVLHAPERAWDGGLLVVALTLLNAERSDGAAHTLLVPLAWSDLFTACVAEISLGPSRMALDIALPEQPIQPDALPAAWAGHIRESIRHAATSHTRQAWQRLLEPQRAAPELQAAIAAALREFSRAD
jgi:hypothetical protein